MYSLRRGLYSTSWLGSIDNRAARSLSTTDRRSDCCDQRLVLASLQPIGVLLSDALLAARAFQSLRLRALELERLAITLANLPKTSIGPFSEFAITELIKSSTIPIWKPFIRRRSRAFPFLPPPFKIYQQIVRNYLKRQIETTTK